MDREEREAFALRSYVLHRIDQAPFAWCHIRTILIAGVGFFADAYDLFAVNIVNILLGYVYTPEHEGTLPSNIDVALKMACSVGTVYGWELILMIIATFGLTIGTTGQSVNVIGVAIFWRIVLGIGIGGDYPNSSVLTSEFATVRWRGAMIGSVFGAQGLGAFSASLVAFCCVIGFKNSLQVDPCDEPCQLALDKSWRIVYGFGILPAVIALYFRLTIPETIRYTLDIRRLEKQAARDGASFLDGVRVEDASTLLGNNSNYSDGFEAPPKPSIRDFIRYFGLWKNGKVLLGTAGSWFLLDVAFYGIGLNTAHLLKAINFNTEGDGTIFLKLNNLTIGNIILASAGMIPGYWVTVAVIDRMGRIPIQLGGFIMLTIIFCIIGFGFNVIPAGGLVALYCLANFFCNFGPNATTFILPGEVFPTRYRSTGHGISAAAGKIGAIISQALIGPLRDIGGKNEFLDRIMQIFALFMFLGVFTTLLVPETKGKTLEELSGELAYISIPEPLRINNLIHRRSSQGFDNSNDEPVDDNRDTPCTEPKTNSTDSQREKLNV